MEDQEVVDGINDLAHEEHALFERAAHQELSPAEHQRLKWLEVRLDQCWDLLHQRRARRSAGMNPDEAQVRDPRTVEGYVG